MKERQEYIRSKGFKMRESYDNYEDYAKMRVGVKTVEDAILNLNPYKKVNGRLSDKSFILKALANHDYNSLREVSNLFFETSGIYQEMCKYYASIYRYDWYLVPFIEENDIGELQDLPDKDAILKKFYKALNFLDNSSLKKLFGQISLAVIREGAYYGYLLDSKEKIIMQQLPAKYSRCRYNVGNYPAIEFNLKYFDDEFSDVQYRLRILKMFPLEFQKAYAMYKRGKLKGDYQGDENGWYLLEPGMGFKFNIGGSDFPILCNAIPAIIDLEEAKEIDKQKMMQKLLKLLIQKLPRDKNDELIFDVDEATDIHNNAVAMLKRAVGVDVLTTFTDVQVEDMADSNSATTSDELERVERTVYNEFGTSQNLFNANSNLALNNSILQDEASIRELIYAYQDFLNVIIKRLFGKGKNGLRVKILETTISNYKDLSKLYKEQTQIGYSKMLPQVALGHSQSEILAMAKFENAVLNLTAVMVPPMMSSTISGELFLGNKSADAGKGDPSNEPPQAQPVKIKDEEAAKGGRPEKSDDEKSEKTIANKESM